MKKNILLIVLVTLLSCKENNIDIPEKKNIKKKNTEKISHEKIDKEIQKIGNLYRPEIMQQEEIEIKTRKKNYRYTLTNSNLLDTDLQNIKSHSRKIVRIYYKFLIKINSPFTFNKIIIQIIHRNGKIDNFEYSEREMKEIIKE